MANAFGIVGRVGWGALSDRALRFGRKPLLLVLNAAAGPLRVGAGIGFAVAFINLAIVVSPPLFGLVAELTDTYRAIWAASRCFSSSRSCPPFSCGRSQSQTQANPA